MNITINLEDTNIDGILVTTQLLVEVAYLDSFDEIEASNACVDSEIYLVEDGEEVELLTNDPLFSHAEAHILEWLYEHGQTLVEDAANEKWAELAEDAAIAAYEARY